MRDQIHVLRKRSFQSVESIIFIENTWSAFHSKDIYKTGLIHQLESTSSQIRFSEGITMNPQSDMADTQLRNIEHGNLILVALKLAQGL